MALYDADWSRQLVHRSIRDTTLRKCSTEQDFAKRREEKSLQSPASVLPFHNCVLSKREIGNGEVEGRGSKKSSTRLG